MPDLLEAEIGRGAGSRLLQQQARTTSSASEQEHLGPQHLEVGPSD
jgi:hypothetical protein